MNFGTKMVKSIGACALFETLFYLPNHFRQTILVNSSKLSFVNTTEVLLDLMNIMFNINRGTNAPIQEFRVFDFFAMYKPFFRATLPYECLSLSLRLMLFDSIYNSELIK